MYVCMYARMLMCMYVWAHALVRVCESLCICVHIHVGEVYDISLGHFHLIISVSSNFISLNWLHLHTLQINQIKHNERKLEESPAVY